jgi:hypothetical protein
MELKFSEPLKSENVTYFFYKPDSQILRAGFKLHSPQILCGGLSYRPAEYRRKPAGAQTKKRSFFRANRHFLNFNIKQTAEQTFFGQLFGIR